MTRGARRGREKALEQVDLLGITPVRLAAWEEVDGRSVLTRPPPGSGGLRGILDGLLHRMSASRVRLDEVGSFAWLHFDGRKTVAEVAVLLREEFGEEVAPAEERLGHLVRLLRREGFLGYLGWDEPP